MGSLKRQQQNVWYAKVAEELSDYNTIQIYSNPIKCRLTCSATSGTPEEISAGIVPDYDRYLTYHKPKYGEKLKLEEGMVLWIDIDPELNENGELVKEIIYSLDEYGEPVLDDDGNKQIETVEYSTPPDYILKRIIDTKKGKVVRYGISRIGSAE